MKESTTNIPRKVLYLDDKTNNLTSFKAAFRREFEIFTASNSKEAYQLIEDHDVSIVIADYKMPDITGVAFLEEVKNRFPDTLRLMLTGHADLPAVVDAINKGEIFRFLAKPWKEEELKNALYSGFKIIETRIELENKTAELTKAYTELDRLVYSTAHDITSPLSNILGLVNLIRIEGVGDGEYLNLVEKTTKKLQMLTRDVLNFHKNKKTEIRQKKVNLMKVLEKSLAEFEYFENAAEIDIQTEVEQDGDFITDKTRLRIVLNNLISNAIKYQDPNKKRKELRIEMKSDSKGLLLIVRDNGIGIHNELQARIFDQYYRASTLSTGAGIGLYIVAEAIELVEGTIEVQSDEGKGTQFRVKIPNVLE